MASSEPKATLTEALAAARAVLAYPEMLNITVVADLLGLSDGSVRLKRERHEIFGLESGTRGIGYPAWQMLEGRQLLPAPPHCRTR
jgi:hypothetical protein